MSYRERIYPSIPMYVVGALVVPAVIGVFTPINFTVGIVLGVAVFTGYVAILVATSPVIEVTKAVLCVGSAKIPLRYVGKVEAYTNREAARAEAGPNLDARAWTVLRGWVKTSVKIEITDDRDPIPYWLVSCRRPNELRDELNRAVLELHKRP